MERATWEIIPPFLAPRTEPLRLRWSLRPQKERAMSVPWIFLTLNMSSRTSFGTGFILRALRPRSSMCVWMPALWKGAVQARTALFGFSPNRRFTCSKAPPLVSTRSKQPMSMMAGATSTSWSTRGTYLPELCHISLYTRENLISRFAISVFLSTYKVNNLFHFLREETHHRIPNFIEPAGV